MFEFQVEICKTIYFLIKSHTCIVQHVQILLNDFNFITLYGKFSGRSKHLLWSIVESKDLKHINFLRPMKLEINFNRYRKNWPSSLIR